MSTSKHLLLAAAVLATLLVSATSQGFTFYKLSFQWPGTICNFHRCKKPIPTVFTIHGLWPQMPNDKPVPPYSNNTNCTNIRPTLPADLLPKLQPIQTQLEQLWPNLYGSNTGFWRHEWEDHGMCSDYPKQPKEYFQAALTLANGRYKPLDVIGIKQGDQTTVSTVLTNIKKRLGKYPQITCNKGTRPPQLREVRFCFDRAKPPSNLRDCPNQTDGTCGRKMSDNIIFPDVSVAELNIIRQVVSV